MVTRQLQVERRTESCRSKTDVLPLCHAKTGTVYLSRCPQSVLNAAALLTFGLRRPDHVSDAIINLHWLRIRKRIQFQLKWPYLRTRSSMAARHRTLVHSSVWPTYQVVELSAPPTPAASSSHSPTVPPLATESFQSLVPRSRIVCHWRSHQSHPWTGV